MNNEPCKFYPEAGRAAYVWGCKNVSIQIHEALKMLWLQSKEPMKINASSEADNNLYVSIIHEV